MSGCRVFPGAAPGILLFFLLAPAQLRADAACVIVTGLGGVPEYEENFLNWGHTFEKLFQEKDRCAVILLDGRTQKREAVLQVIDKATGSLTPQGELWIVLIGHGNHDGKEFRFNINGPDLSESDLHNAMNRAGNRRIYLIAATSASGALIRRLSARNRVILTATRNHFERQPPLFPSFFLEAFKSPESDADQNGKVSLLEAFLFSRTRVESWYQEKGRLQTEHPLLDDNGDGEGSPEPRAVAGEGQLASISYLSAPPIQEYTTAEARELARNKVRLEREVEDLKFQKGSLAEAEYYKQLEQLLLQLARVSEQLRALEMGK